MRLSWFLVRRSNTGGVEEVRGEITKEGDALAIAERLNESSTLIAFLSPSGRLYRMPRWTVHWRLA